MSSGSLLSEPSRPSKQIQCPKSRDPERQAILPSSSRPDRDPPGQTLYIAQTLPPKDSLQNGSLCLPHLAISGSRSGVEIIEAPWLAPQMASHTPLKWAQASLEPYDSPGRTSKRCRWNRGLKVRNKTAETTTAYDPLVGPETHPNGPGTVLGTFVGGHIQCHPLLAV